MLQYFYKCLEHKALEKDENKKNELPKIDEENIKYMIPNKKLFENNKYVSFLPKVFPIQEKDKVDEKKKRVFWKDVITNEFEDVLTQQRIEEKLNAKKPESKKTISAITPIEDFREMIDNKNEDLAEKAMELMSDIIHKLIRESFKGSYYIKAIECIKAYRDAANDEDEVDLFNDFLNDLKEKFPKEQYMDFWTLFCDNKITLISEKENQKSKYKEAQCQEWLESISQKDAIPSSIKDMGDLLLDID
jgi:ATP-dependent DNA helicase 2 subunit 2